MIFFKNLIIRYVSVVKLIFTDVQIFLNWHLYNSLNSPKKIKRNKTHISEIERERKHTFIEVKNEMIYGESIVNKLRGENLITFIIL